MRNVTGARAEGAADAAPTAGRRLDFGAATIAPHATWTAQAIGHDPAPAACGPRATRSSTRDADAVRLQGRQLGGYFTYSGIRTIAVTPDGRLELNGRLLDLRGVNLHEQTLRTGAALDAGPDARS